MIRDQDETASGQRQGDEHLNEGSPAAADDASADRPDGPGSPRQDSAGPKAPAPDGAVTDDTKDAKALKDAKGAKDAKGRKPERDTSHTLAPGERLETVASADRIEIESDEPLLSARVHRPSDLLRMVLGLLGIGLVLVIANFAHGTTAGLEQDIDKGTSEAPDLLISLTGLASSIAVLLVPVAFAIERLIKRDGLRIADGVLAAVLAHGASLAVDLWVAQAAPDSIRDALTKAITPSDATTPVHSYLAPVIAYMTAVGMARRPRWRVVLWAVLLLNAFAVLVPGYTTAFSIVITVLIGWTIAYGTLYAVGTPNVRPTGQTLLAGLRRVGFKPVGALRVEDPSEADKRDHNDRGRRYRVTLEDGPPLDVTVVDREQQAQGFFYRVWRRLALRGITQRRSLQSLRQALEQEALLAYAAISAGANAPRLIATSELGPDAVMLVYEHIGGRSLDALPDEEITDELMRTAWHQVKALQSRRIAHRRLVGDALLVDLSGAVYLTDLRGGEIAAGDLILRMDVAQLLTTLGLRVGAERSVAAAVDVLGPDAIADSLPLLQPIALSRSTRTTLRRLAKERAQREREAVIEASRGNKETKTKEAKAKEAVKGGGKRAHRKSLRAEKHAEKKAIDEALEGAREEDLLAQIRHQVLLIRPQAPIEPARLERIRPRTLVSFIAGTLAAYFLLTQLSQVPLDRVLDANWAWVGGAVFFSCMTYVFAAMSLLGFVPEKVSFLRTVQAQVAGSFVKLVAPAAVGGVALNARFLQRSGVRPGHAVASVGASQLFGLGSHITLLLLFGYITGTEHTPTLSPSRAVIAGLLTAAVLVLIVTAVPALRRFVSNRVRSLFAGVVPRMLDVVQRPQKLLTGVLGMLLLTLAFVMCLDSCVRAFGHETSYANLAVVFLTANALGSAAPTPGGLGAVEAALIAALIAFGVPKEVATPAVLLFRLLTLWMPVLPGWLTFTQLTRKGAL
ncbi:MULTISPECIES: flippase-like domain-containing protein [unclassified Streptomyces]|uniref:flippase-like domain-containing protein n=1 Tax=unclassified Streptomyces TaxID=2593676 RepID=UPI002DDB1E6A|nr:MULTISPECIES: flippase-like domain-containing protein [unclassified Streptomyces]WSA92499.1 flippase-like domain-containing protein [Streptomyces sp. NBC_01795]WSB76865.1 flippase-like domain-containing protein [Streptomyces sp. NBC_01775]WSS14861.1 flippase-like domain-containing protein [Streptomyces sp. NBC_01186]WSS43696.1 flippase-like domain-containing protein [Streptomyces sp. NBC_01187]